MISAIGKLSVRGIRSLKMKRFFRMVEYESVDPDFDDLGLDMVHYNQKHWLSGWTPCGIDLVQDRESLSTRDKSKVTCPKCAIELESVQ